VYISVEIFANAVFEKLMTKIYFYADFNITKLAGLKRQTVLQIWSSLTSHIPCSCTHQSHSMLMYTPVTFHAHVHTSKRCCWYEDPQK